MSQTDKRQLETCPYGEDFWFCFSFWWHLFEILITQTTNLERSTRQKTKWVCIYKHCLGFRNYHYSESQEFNNIWDTELLSDISTLFRCLPSDTHSPKTNSPMNPVRWVIQMKLLLFCCLFWAGDDWVTAPILMKTHCSSLAFIWSMAWWRRRCCCGRLLPLLLDLLSNQL